MDLYFRENYLKKIRGFYNDDDLIKVITGVRRCGKSSLLKMIMAELASGGVSDENIIFLDLDAPKNRKVTDADALEEMILAYSNIKGLKYLFIDEIQNVSGFESVINGIRGEGDFSVFITGSNSYLLSGELMTKLTGRYLEFEILPLSFEEYLGMKEFYKKEINPNLLIELNSYIVEGGFPRTILIDDIKDKRKYVSDLVNEIFVKDIKRRVKIRDVSMFESVRNFLIGNAGSYISINSLQKSLRGQDINVSRTTIARYIDVLVSAKILYECPRFDLKSKRALSGEKKYYLSDLSFYFSLAADNRINYGPTLENIVFNYAKSKDYAISVGRIGKFECDFIVRGTDMNYAYIQVAFTIGESIDTEEREYRPLEMVKDNYPKYVMTTDYLLQRRGGISHVNIMEFMKSGMMF